MPKIPDIGLWGPSEFCGIYGALLREVLVARPRSKTATVAVAGALLVMDVKSHGLKSRVIPWKYILPCLGQMKRVGAYPSGQWVC